MRPTFIGEDEPLFEERELDIAAGVDEKYAAATEVVSLSHYGSVR